MFVHNIPELLWSNIRVMFMLNASYGCVQGIIVLYSDYINLYSSYIWVRFKSYQGCVLAYVKFYVHA